jgi:hypothetical protein
MDPMPNKNYKASDLALSVIPTARSLCDGFLFTAFFRRAAKPLDNTYAATTVSHRVPFPIGVATASPGSLELVVLHSL